ncbi:hypothetical protein CPB86DRAFT_780124 [Serendipita vermifera]|nr:hypothetical protein CPB86DRAFT_780124 [Serendipita vermifera]
MTDVTSLPEENEVPKSPHVTSHATATPESEQISTRRPQASGTMDPPAPETGTRDSNSQSSHTRNGLGGMMSGANNSNGEILTAYPGGGGNNGASNEHGSTQDSDREDRNRVSDSFNSHAPTIGNSSQKAFRLSNQAAGVIGATVGVFFALLIAFAWYRFRRAGTGFLKLKA